MEVSIKKDPKRKNIATVPSFRRGRHRRQSEAIVEEGMGPDD